MEMLLYLMGNWCVLGAACLIIVTAFKAMKADPYTGGGGKVMTAACRTSKLQISGDLRMMLLAGAIARVYWSCSPPRIWEQEELPIQVISIADIFFSCAAWIVIVGIFYNIEGNVRGEHPNLPVVPVYLRWYVLTPLAMVTGGVVAYFFLPAMDIESWPLADTMVVFNMIIDGLAMVPQMYMIAKATEDADPTAGHFVGLLCVSRVFRMLFWMLLFFVQQYYILAFIVPDCIHTVIMADYLYLWLKKMKKEKFDPMMHEALGHYV